MRTRYTFALCSAWLALTNCLHGTAPSVTYSLSTDTQAAAPTEKVAVTLVAMNPTDWTVEVAWPASIPGTLVVSDMRWNVSLTKASDGPGSIWLSSREFSECVYNYSIPDDAIPGAGFLEARLAGDATLRAGVVIGTEALSQRPSLQPPPRQPTNSLVHPEPALSALSRSFAERIGPHEPIYFIYGPDDPAAKFQFSLKYKMLDLGSVSRKWASRTIQFGYTQCSLWDIGAESSPFHDTSYMPELMLEALTPASEREGRVNWLGFQAGYKHESNGRDGLLSRSVDIAQIRAGVALGDLDGWHAIILPRIWTYIGTSEYNDDIEDYRGYGMLRVIVGRNDGPTVSISSWAGKDFDHGSLQIDVNIPVRMNILDIKTYLIVQYFNGYGESLRDYSEKSETIRAGFAIVR